MVLRVSVGADWGFRMMDGRCTDLVWVVDSGWASPNLAALAVKKTLGLPATTCLVGMRLAGGFDCRLPIKAPSEPSELANLMGGRAYLGAAPSFLLVGQSLCWLAAGGGSGTGRLVEGCEV